VDRIAAVALGPLFLRPVDLATVQAMAQARGMAVTDWASEVLAACAADYRAAQREAAAGRR
jgi:hypothetical protein